MRSIAIVFRKELREILRDRRTLIAIGLAALATPLILLVISQVSSKTATQDYAVGYSGDIPVGLDTLLAATGLKLERLPDPAAAAKQQVDLGVVFSTTAIDEYYDPTRQSAQIADTRLQTVLGTYNAAKAAAALKEKGIDPGILNPLPLRSHPLSSPVQAAGNALLSFFLPYILITMCLTGGLSAARDSSAGERERKTLESLLLTPAPRSHLLVGKILAVSTISLAAAVAAIGSMLVALTQIAFPGGQGGGLHIGLSPLAAVVILWLAVLLAASFRSVTPALGTLARNLRQCQAFATPPSEPIVQAFLLAVTAAGALGGFVRELRGTAVMHDYAPRPLLEIADHRNAPDRDRVAEEVLSRGEKTVVYVVRRDECVRLAAHLRTHGEAQARRIGYVHEGLPARLRQIITQAFREGRLDGLVATPVLDEEGLPADVRQVMVAELPWDRDEFLAACGSAGLDHRPGTLTLAFGHHEREARRLVSEAGGGGRECGHPRPGRCEQRLDRSRSGVVVGIQLAA